MRADNLTFCPKKSNRQRWAALVSMQLTMVTLFAAEKYTRREDKQMPVLCGRVEQQAHIQAHVQDIRKDVGSNPTLRILRR